MLIIPIVIVQWLVYKVAGTAAASIVSLIFYYPAYAVAVKRSNDRNRPQWIIQSIMVFVAAFNLLTAFAGTPVPSPSGWQMIGGFINMLLGLYMLVDLGGLRGTVGDNRYGPDPLAGQQT